MTSKEVVSLALFSWKQSGTKDMCIYDKASHALTDGLDEMSGYAKWALNHMLPAEKNSAALLKKELACANI